MGSRPVSRFPEPSWTDSLACPFGVFEAYSPNLRIADQPSAANESQRLFLSNRHILIHKFMSYYYWKSIGRISHCF
jgi:hypothetical protein